MSTRAIIIRKDADGMLEFAQTKYDGMDNTEMLNAYYREEDKVNELFHRMSKQGLGGLEKTLDSCYWYDEGELYFYGKVAAFDFSVASVRKWLDEFDFPEFASVWDGSQWHDFPSPMFSGTVDFVAFLRVLFAGSKVKGGAA